MKLTYILLSAACSLSLTAAAQEKQAPQLGVDPVKDVIAAMTLDEKVEFIHGTGMGVAVSGNGPVAGSVGGPVPGAAGLTYAIPRLGIPSIVMADGPAGLRIDSMRPDDPKRYYATAFPTGTILASTWNAELLHEVGCAMGNEAHEYGVDVLLAPGINIQRNLLCGRNYEYYSEDPCVSGQLGAAFVRGVQSQGVGVSVKHFAANNQETGRAYVNSVVEERALREIYLRAFETIVKEADPWTIMSAYNKLNGTYTSESKPLLTTVLRGDWGFRGCVMTDWFAGKNYPAQLLAGNDLLMPSRKSETKKVRKALTDGTMTEADIDRNIERILRLILQCPTFKHYAYSNAPDLKAHAEVARRAAAEGIVLLKNDAQALPLSKGNVTVLGNASYETYIGGTGSGEVAKAYVVSVAQGLRQAGCGVARAQADRYRTHIREERAKQPARNNILQKVNTLPEIVWTPDELKQMAARTEVAVITLGRNAGEGNDRKEATDFLLSEAEKTLIKRTADAFHAVGKKVVVVLNVDGLVEVASWRDQVDAILLAWMPGQEAGNAVADVLTGAVNPSGKLAITLPVTYADVPSAETFPGVPADRPDSAVYNEGIYVGYRYANTFKKAPAYEFGYGLSYTTFQMDKLKLGGKTFDGDALTVSVTVRNTGKTAGKEVVQLYLSAPTTNIDKPTEELRAFAKTRLLQPGEKQTVTLTLKLRDLSSFYPQLSAWVADAGTYTVKVGNSSRNFLRTATFRLKETVTVEKTHNALAPQSEIAFVGL